MAIVADLEKVFESCLGVQAGNLKLFNALCKAASDKQPPVL